MLTTLDRMLLIKALAVLQIFVSLVNLVTRIGTLDRVRAHCRYSLPSSHMSCLWVPL